MPLINLEILQDPIPQPELDSEQVQQLCDAIGQAMGSRQAGTWLKVSYLSRGQYAENQELLVPDIRPVFAYIIRAELLPNAQLQEEAQRLAAVIGQHLDRPQQNIHIIYEPEGKGRIAFGGQLVE